jgi:hypothetical protein
MMGIKAEKPTSLDDIIGESTGINELRENALYKVRDKIADIDMKPVILPLNARYCLIIYADASFAVGDKMQSVSGHVVYLNGTPLLWASLKQTIIVDSSCSAEFVSASVACKQTIHAENMISFLVFSCPKPYVMYTDSYGVLGYCFQFFALGKRTTPGYSVPPRTLLRHDWINHYEILCHGRDGS